MSERPNSMNQGPDSQGVSRGKRFQVVPRVLVFVTSDKEVLLLRGAPDKKIWRGLLNGVGGHVEADEEPLTAAQRELKEECGLAIGLDAFRLSAVINIDLGDRGAGVLLFVFVAEAPAKGTIASTEGTPEWHDIEQLSDLPMVEDLPWLLNTILPMGASTGPTFARYSYDGDGALQITATN